MSQEWEWIIKLAPDQQLLFPNCSDFSRNCHQSPHATVTCPLLLSFNMLVKIVWIWERPRTQEQQKRALICVCAATLRAALWHGASVLCLPWQAAGLVDQHKCPQPSRAAPSSRQGRAWESQTITPFNLTVFFSQQVFNPNLSLSEWNLTEMEASLSPVRDVSFWDMIIKIIEPQNGQGWRQP